MDTVAIDTNWLVRLQVVISEDVRSEEVSVQAKSGATAGAKAVGVAKGFGWRVLAIEDVRVASIEPSLESNRPLGKILQFPGSSSGKPN